MKGLILIALLLITTTAIAQNKTEIYIIGNIHENVPNYNPQVLFSILNKIKPDIILHEVDNKGMNEYLQMENPKGNEILASNLYLKKYPNTLRFPFDFEGRNQYRKDRGMVPTDNLTIKLIDSLYRTKMLEPGEIKIYEDFNKVTDQLIAIAKLSPENFNNRTTDSISERRQNYQYRELLKIIENRPEFLKNFVTKPNGEEISYREGFKLMSDFWDLRNQTMAQNIYNIANKNQHKRMVVLTGFLHRYYLIKELTRLDTGTYIIKEFYDKTL